MGFLSFAATSSQTFSGWKPDPAFNTLATSHVGNFPVTHGESSMEGFKGRN